MNDGSAEDAGGGTVFKRPKPLAPRKSQTPTSRRPAPSRSAEPGEPLISSPSSALQTEFTASISSANGSSTAAESSFPLATGPIVRTTNAAPEPKTEPQQGNPAVKKPRFLPKVPARRGAAKRTTAVKKEEGLFGDALSSSGGGLTAELKSILLKSQADAALRASSRGPQFGLGKPNTPSANVTFGFANASPSFSPSLSSSLPFAPSSTSSHSVRNLIERVRVESSEKTEPKLGAKSEGKLEGEWERRRRDDALTVFRDEEAIRELNAREIMTRQRKREKRRKQQLDFERYFPVSLPLSRYHPLSEQAELDSDGHSSEDDEREGEKADVGEGEGDRERERDQERASLFEANQRLCSLLLGGEAEESPSAPNFLFFQLPSALPLSSSSSSFASPLSQSVKRVPSENDKKDENGRSASHLQQPGSVQKSTELEKREPERHQHFTQGDVSSGLKTLVTQRPGFMGTIRVYEDSSVRLQLGNSEFELGLGSECNFYQEVASICADEEKRECHFLGTVKRDRIIVSPSIDDVLKS